MTDLELLIQNIMKYQKTNIMVEIITKNLEKYTGYITQYTGEVLYIDGNAILLNNISTITKYIKDTTEHGFYFASRYLMQRLEIVLSNAKIIDGVLIKIKGNELTYINERERKTISIDEVSKIIYDGNEIVIKKEKNFKANENVGDIKDIIVDTIREQITNTKDIVVFKIPNYVNTFLSSDYRDAESIELKENWEKKYDELKKDSYVEDDLKICAIRIGIVLIEKQEDNVDERIMFEIFKIIKKNIINDKNIIFRLHNIFQRYINGYTDLVLLSESVYKHKKVISNLGLMQKFYFNSRVSRDISEVRFLIEILTNIANDLANGLEKEVLNRRLNGYQYELNSKFSQSKLIISKNALIRMIQEQINIIYYVPKLLITHIEKDNANNSLYNWNEIWFEGATCGHIRGTVINNGKAPAKKIKLNIMVNSKLRESYFIEEIMPNRKISFTARYDKNDVENGEVKWSVTALYCGESTNNILSSNCFGKINVIFNENKSWLSHLGLENFDATRQALGDAFCGRTNELHKLNNLYSLSIDASIYPSLLITGLRRAGKSSIIKNFIEILKKNDSIAPIYIDAQGIGTNVENAFFNMVFNSLEYNFYHIKKEIWIAFMRKWQDISKKGEWISLLQDYFVELYDLLGNRKIIFIMDEMENVFYSNYFDDSYCKEQFFGIIRFLIQNYQRYVSFIFCGSDKLLTSCLDQNRESQMFQVLQKVYIGRMSSADIRDIFKKYNQEYDVKFGEEAINAIMFYTNGLVWYTKIIAYHILDKILDEEHIIRDEIQTSDVDEIVEKLISGDLGTDLIDLLDNNFGPKRKAIVRAMALAGKQPNDSVSVEMIKTEINKMNYIDDMTGEAIKYISDFDIEKNLRILVKMDFIEKSPHKENEYKFTTELYRLLMSRERKIDKFILVNGGTTNG